MAETPSTMIPLGTEAPEFCLPSPDGKWVALSDFHSCTGLVVVFMCNHCPYVQMLRESISEFARECQTSGIGFVAISSNNAEKYPDDSPEKMGEEISAFGYQFPYLYDEDQSVARAYKAACTPDFYLFDGQMKLVYRGQYDDARPGNGVEVTGKDLKAAVTALKNQLPVPTAQKPSIGCNIKWKAGNEPDYFTPKK